MNQRHTWTKDKHGLKTNMNQRQTWTKDKHGPETNMDQRKNMELRKILSRDQD